MYQIENSGKADRKPRPTLDPCVPRGTSITATCGFKREMATSTSGEPLAASWGRPWLARPLPFGLAMRLLMAFALIESITGLLIHLQPDARCAFPSHCHRGSIEAVVCLQGTSRRRGTEEDDDESISDADVEDLFFMYDDSGAAKPWAVKPHLQTMLSELERGDAVLLDVRSAAAFKAGQLALATSYPLSRLAKQLEEEPLDPSLTIYIHSSFEEEQLASVAAEQLMAAGFSQVHPLAESYEALKAQLKR